MNRCAARVAGTRAAALAALLLAAPAAAQPLPPPPPESPADIAAPLGTEATGSALVGSDAVRARERALQQAMSRALEAAVTLAAPEARGRLYQVSARAREYLSGYRVLSEGEADGQFQVRIAAQVDLPRLLRDLQGAGSAPTARPRARAVVLACPDPAGPAPDPAALAAVRDALASQAEVPPASACPAAADQLVPALATAAAQAALLVSAAPPSVDPIRGTLPVLFGAHAQVHLTLVAATGKVHGEASAPADSSADHPDAALRAAVTSSALSGVAALRPPLGALLPGAASDGVTVSLEGLSSYPDYRRVSKTLAALAGVRAAEPRRFTPGLAEVLLRTDANAESIGAILGRTPIQSVRLQVMPQSPARLRVLVASESALPGAPASAEPEEPAQ